MKITLSVAIAAAVTSLSYLASPVQAAILTFEPGDPVVTTDYSGLAIGEAVRKIGWTGGDAAIDNIKAAAPRNADKYGGGGSLVIEPSAGARRLASSPEVTGLPQFEGGQTVYFSTWMNRYGSNSSGARVALRYSSGGQVAYVGGFGIVDGKPSGVPENNPFAIGVTTWNDEGQSSLSWVYGEEYAVANHWYEIALVVELDPTDVSLSLGYLFIRDASAGESAFRLVEGLSGVRMGFTEDHNLNQFTYWRLEGFQNQLQLGPLSVGFAAIPEPSTAALQLSALLLLAAPFAFRRLGKRRK